MAEFVTLAKLADLPEGRSHAYRVGTKTIALFHEPGGRFHAIDDYCPHMGASLAEGTVEDGVVTCAWHAWQFRLSDGTWVNSPKLKIGCYEVRVVGEEIQVKV
jgi:nitrite reductase (NADH) small subunit/3-phenylpropionate/trans-cinnamate dioxygenase ferredoxin subunit